MRRPVNWHAPICTRRGDRIIQVYVNADNKFYPVVVQVEGSSMHIGYTSGGYFLANGLRSEHNIINCPTGYQIPKELLAAYPDIFGKPTIPPGIDWSKPIRFRVPDETCPGPIVVLTTNAETPRPVWIAYQESGVWVAHPRFLDGRVVQGLDSHGDVVQAPIRSEVVQSVCAPESASPVANVRVVFEDGKPITATLEEI